MWARAGSIGLIVIHSSGKRCPPRAAPLGRVVPRPGLVARVYPAPAVSPDHELASLLRPPAAAVVGFGVAGGLPGADERIDYLPRPFDLVAAWEDRVLTGQHLTQHVLVGFGKLPAGQASVLQVHAG